MAVQLDVPVHGFGPLTISTAGGTSAPFTPNFLNPGLGDLRDLSFASGNLWVARQAGELRKIDPATGQTLVTFNLPPGGASSGIGLQIAPAALTLANIPVPAGSLLVSNWNGNPDQIFAVNPTTGVVIAALQLQQNIDPVSLLYDPAGGGHLYLLDSSPSAILEIDRNTGGTLATIDIRAR